MKGFGSTKKLGLLALLGLILVVPTHTVQAQAAPVAIAQASGEQATPQTRSNAKESEQEMDEGDQYKHSPMVKKIGAMMGMSTETAAHAFEWLNFAVLAIALIYGMAKVLPKLFRDRTSAIQKELSEARSATEEASVRLNSVEERLAKLDGQIAAMKTQAESDAAVEEQRFRAAAEDEKKKILASAEQEIASASQQAQRHLQEYAAGLAIDQAAKRLVITAETDRLLVRNFAQRLSQNKDGQN